MNLVRLPRNSVEHVHGDKIIPSTNVMETMLYLFKKHPRKMIVPCIKLTLRKIGLIGDKDG